MNKMQKEVKRDGTEVEVTVAIEKKHKKGLNETKIIVITALCIALVFVATMLINIRLPLMGSGGLIHLGNVPLFLAAIIFGKKTGAVAGGVGMGLFDLFSGWTAWAPFTFVIVGIMGYLIGLITEKKMFGETGSLFLAGGVAVIVKVVGYYFAEGILYGNWIAPFGSVLGNVLQVTVAFLIILPIANRLKREAEKIWK